MAFYIHNTSFHEFTNCDPRPGGNTAFLKTSCLAAHIEGGSGRGLAPYHLQSQIESQQLEVKTAVTPEENWEVEAEVALQKVLALHTHHPPTYVNLKMPCGPAMIYHINIK